MNNCKIIFDPIHGPQELPLICIQIINTILGQGLNSMHADINSPAFVTLNSTDDNLILNIFPLFS